MKKSLMLVLFFSLSIMSIQIVNAQQFRKKNLHKDNLKDQLNLTEEQEEKIQDIRFNHHEMMIDIRSELQKNRLKMKKLLADNNFDENSLYKIIDNSTKLQNTKMRLKAKKWLEIRSLLDKEQQKIWTKRFELGKELRDDVKRRSKRGKHHRDWMN